MRGTPTVQRLAIAAGVVLIGFKLFGGRLHPEPIDRNVFLGLMLVLTGWGNLLDMRKAPVASTSVGRLLLGIAALASGAVWLGIAIHWPPPAV